MGIIGVAKYQGILLISNAFWNIFPAMLNQMRKYGKSWLVKTIFGAIIVSFIAFFGYSNLDDRQFDRNRYVAKVGKTYIPRKRFEMAYQATLERMKEGFKGEVPEGLEKILKDNVRNQLVSRELLVQYAQQLGLHVSENEIALAIQSNKGLLTDGRFDVRAYEEQFLPYYQQKYGENFEEVIKRDLLIEKLQALMLPLFSPWEKELEGSLGKIQKSQETVASKKTFGKSPKKNTPETNPETHPVTTISSDELFALWVDHFREKSKIEVLE